jgi:hypothetical protein
MNQIQKANDELDKAAKAIEAKIAASYAASMTALRNNVSLRELARLIDESDYNGILRLFHDDIVVDRLQPVKAAINNGVIAGGTAAASIQPAVTGLSGTRVTFVFDALNPMLAQISSTITADRIRVISEDVRQVIRQVVTDGVISGHNPNKTARRVKQSIGLTANQERAVSNYRQALETADARALRSNLRDRRSDRRLERIIRDGGSLTPEQIDNLTDRYRQRYLKYRAQTIARTESIRAVQGAQHALTQQAINEGKILPEQVRRFWIYTKDSRTRAEHRMIPNMNSNGVGQNEPFNTPLGPLMYPADPNGSAANTINCRCTVFTRVISLELVVEDAA